MSTDRNPTATIYRLVTPDHVCPYGLKSIDLLERHDFEVVDRHLETEEKATELREALDVETTPQTFIDGELVGTLDDLRRYLGQKAPIRTRRATGRCSACSPPPSSWPSGAAQAAEGTWFSARTVEGSWRSRCAASATSSCATSSRSRRCS